jgi:hypothetical protein
MDALKVGDVIVPQVGRLVLVNYRNVIVSDEGECVVEAIRHFGPGAEDDHFTAPFSVGITIQLLQSIRWLSAVTSHLSTFTLDSLQSVT